MEDNLSIVSSQVSLTAHLLVLVGCGVLLMLLDALGQRRLLPWAAAAGLVASAVLAFPGGVHAPADMQPSFNMIYAGGLPGMVHVLLCAVAAFSLLFMGHYLGRMQRPVPEVYALVVFAVVGMSLLANAADLLMVFIGLETMSICLYILAALFRTDPRSTEAGYKYFLLGAFASGFLLYGMALMYGLAHSTNLEVIQRAVYSSTAGDSIAGSPMFMLSVGLMLVGLLFKVAAFPFHAWTPDVYTGAPSPMAGFLAAGNKLAVFVAFAFFFIDILPANDYLPGPQAKVHGLLAVLGVASILYGNIVALQQKNLKRVLAYSSIAHSGYLLLGLMAGRGAVLPLLFYLTIYALTTLGAFGVISMLERQDSGLNQNDWRGLGLERPFMGVALSVFLLSLAGLPPLAGFMGKYLVFGELIREGLKTGQDTLVWMAGLGIVASLIGAAYYLGIIRVMFFRASPQQVPTQPVAKEPALNPQPAGLGPRVGALVLGVLLVVLGLLPGLLFGLLSNAFAGTDAFALQFWP